MSDSGGLAEGTARLHIDQSRSKSGNAVDEEAPTEATLPSEPQIVGNKRLWNITEDFRAAAATLPTGYLIKDETFTLFESVGALEIMDPKMDSGFLGPGESLYDTYDVLQKLQPEEVIGIMDQLFQYEMVWHSGYPLSQSLFACHYIDALLWPEPKILDECQFYRGERPSAADDPMITILRAFCVGLIKCCDWVIHIVLQSHYFEEEDFSTHTFNRNLLNRTHENWVLVDLQDALEILTEIEIAEEARTALFSRLSFRKQLLSTLSECTTEPGTRRDWSRIATFASEMNESHNLGKAVPAAFSHKIQRKLMSTVPPRPIIEVSWETSLKSVRQLCDECREGAGIFDATERGPEAIKAFLLHFSTRKPTLLPFSRSYVSNVLLERYDDFFDRTLRQDLKLLVLPGSSILDESNWTVEQPLTPGTPHPQFEMAQVIDAFAARCIPDFGGYIDFWKALCSNRCRLRRMLCHVLLRLDELQRDGEELDGNLEDIQGASDGTTESVLFRWASNQKLQVMEWIIQLGFELEVYLPEEYAGMYWLLSSISSRRASLLLQLHWSATERLRLLDQQQEASDSHNRKAVNESIDLIDVHIQLTRGNESLAEGLYTVYTFLHYLHLIRDPSSTEPYFDPAFRYELRMKPFLTLQDGFLEMYNDFLAVTHPFGEFSRTDTNPIKKGGPLCDIADQAVREARSRFSQLKALGAAKAQTQIVESAWTAEVSNFIKTTVSAGLAISVLKKAVLEQRLSDLIVDIPKPGERYHEFWVVPKIRLS